jgi:outer membrane protein assembly factor BamB
MKIDLIMDQTEKTKRAKRIAIIAGAFTALVSLLMLLNYLQIRGSEPLESKALTLLVDRLSLEPNNKELIQEIRHLDLLARKAYFSSLWQINTGAFLLLIGAIVFVVALRTYYSLQFSIDLPDEETNKSRKNRLLAQRWIGIAGVVTFLMAGLSAFYSADYIGQYQTMQVAMTGTPTDDGIERVKITSREDIQEQPGNLVADKIIEEGAVSDEGEQATEAKPTSEVVSEPVAEAVPVSLTANAVRQNFNSFRGPWGNGISTHRNVPTDWDGNTGHNILWKKEIPIHGFNSPVIWGDKLFLSGGNASKRVVYCLDRHSGEILWEREANNITGSPATPPKTTDDTGLAAPSLTADGQRVYAIFGTGDIIAFDFNGNRVWARNLGVPNNHYGHSSSLLTWDNMVFVQYDTQSGSRVLAIDATSGKTVWETSRTNDVSWASPILAEVNGIYQLIVVANPDFTGYDIKTGRQLWNVPSMSGEVGPSPAYGGGLVYAANEYATMIAVDPSNGNKVWEDRYYLPEVASPVYHDGFVYIATTFAVLASFEAATGEFVWEFDGDDQFYSSPLIADGKLYVFDTNGKAYIFKPGKEPELIASPQLGEKVYSTPAFADGRIYVRGYKNLYCIGTN